LVANISGPVNNPAKAAAGSNQWWIVVTPNTQGNQYKIIQGSAASVQGQYGQYAQGPFATRADAQAAAGGALSPGQVASAAGAGLTQGLTPTMVPTGISAGLSIFDVGHWLGVLVTNLTNIAMWRSLGWLALGALLLILGLALWLKSTDTFQSFAKDAYAGALAA
jgi:hypothetical protein